MEKFSEEMQQYIANNYYDKTAKELAEELGVSYGYIRKIWGKYELKGKTNTSRKGNDLINQTFGFLTVIAESPKRASNGGKYWICKCNCNRPNCLGEKEILGQSLKSGKTISCGAIGKEKLIIGQGMNFIDLSGQKFGKLTVIERIEDKILSNGDKKVQYKCKCDCGREINVLSDNLKKGNTQTCGRCEERSHGNIKISQILDEANIFYEREKRFESCKDKSYLPFDFYVNNQYIIEFDGKQHFENTNSFYDYDYTHKHDLIKNKWCKDNNIPLIRIPYTHYNDLTLEDLLLESSNYIIK